MRKKKPTRIIAYILLLIVIVIFMMTIGLKLFVNSILLIVDITSSFNKNNQTTNNKYEIVLIPELNDYSFATNSAQTKIAGIGQPNNRLDIYVNSSKQQQLIIDKNNQFETYIKLKPGKNIINLVSFDKEHKITKKSKIYEIQYYDIPPNLTIDSPADASIFSSDGVAIIGTTDNEVIVRINGTPVVVDSEGKFSTQETLKPGENVYLITATDIAGNQTSQALTLTYQPE